MTVTRSRRTLLIIALGVAFEHFDMMLVSLLASSMVEEFIGGGSAASKLLYAYAGYAIAFVFRPLGAFCFGLLGDIYGRKISLISSMMLMSMATLSLAFIPSVREIGVAAITLFFLCRMVQGLAVGGEYGTAITYAFELDPRFRTFYGSCIVSATHVGGLIASLIASQYVSHFRVGFLMAGVGGFVLLLLRSCLKESPVKSSARVSQIAMESMKDKNAISMALIIASMLVLVFYGSLLYLNELIYQHVGVPRDQIFRANSFLLAIWIMLPPCIGYLVDKIGVSYLRVMAIGAIGVFLSAPVLGLALVFSTYEAILASQIILHIFHMTFCLCTPRFFGDLFASQARNTSISFSYSLGASFTAALAPMICYLSISIFHTNFAICLPFMLVSVMAILILKKENLCSKTILLNSTT